MQVDETPLRTEKLPELSQNEISNQKNDRTPQVHSKGYIKKMQLWEAGGLLLLTSAFKA